MKMGRVASAFLFATFISLEGCTWSPAQQSWPVPPEEVVRYEAPNLAPVSGKFEQMSIAIEYVKGLREMVVARSVDRSNRDWATSDFTSLGVVGAMAGALADQTGLLNTGAGMSVLGVTARDRYQYGTQQAAYAGAREVLDCMLTQIQSTNDKEVEWAVSQQSSPETAEAASALPTAVVETTNKVKESLISRLLSIKSEPIKASEFNNAYKAQIQAYQEQQKAANNLEKKVDADLQLQAQFSTLDFTPEPAEQAAKNRLDHESSLVPIYLQEQVGMKIVGMKAKLAACVAGY